MSATTITVRVPFAIKKRGGRKIVVAPDGSVLPGAPRQARTTSDPALLKALARAFRWRRMLEDGRYASVSDIARAEKIDRTYAGDILRLTLLAPEIVEAIVEGRQPAEMTLPVLMKPFALEWVGQSAEACGKSEDSYPAPTGTQNKMPTFVPTTQY
jgi:hypothetical protein